MPSSKMAVKGRNPWLFGLGLLGLVLLIIWGRQWFAPARNEATPHIPGPAQEAPRTAQPSGSPPTVGPVNDYQPDPDAATLTDAINLAASYLVRACAEDGRFRYQVNLNPAVPERRNYNILRHAGAVYALAEYQRLAADAAVAAAIKRALDFMVKKAVAPVPGKEGLDAVWSRPELDGTTAPVTAKLGGAGLGLVALLAAEKVMPGAIELEQPGRIGNFILFLQKRDGSFYSKYIPTLNGRQDKWTSLYYPGEAALGLLRLYEFEPRPEWLKGGHDALAYLARIRFQRRQVEADHWALLATAALMPHYDEIKDAVPKTFLLNHAVQICRSMLAEAPDFAPERPEFGALTRDARTCPSATRLEGLLAALSFLPPEETALRKAIVARVGPGIKFLVKAQIKSGPYRGGIPNGLVTTLGEQRTHDPNAAEIRVDYVQHALSAMLQFHQEFYGKEEKNFRPDAETLGEKPDAGALGGKLEPPASFQKEVSDEDFAAWLEGLARELVWPREDYQLRLDGAILRDSVRLGTRFLINNQKPAGNFNYQYDFVTKKMDSDDNQVRQAGALWGLALLYRFEPTEACRQALEKGLEFFFTNTHLSFGDQALMIKYPGDRQGKTGTVALVALSIIEYLRAADEGKVEPAPDYRRSLAEFLRGYLAHLTLMRLDSGHFSESYDWDRQSRTPDFSPYFDGETMLCLIKAAKYLGHQQLIPMIEDSAFRLAKFYTADQWQHEPDSGLTKGFFQWSCMAFGEYSLTQWKHAELYRHYVTVMAWWMIHVHELPTRTRNTAYAFEGLAYAYQLAVKNNQPQIADRLRADIDRGLFKLTTWQVGGPLSSFNRFLTQNPTNDPLAIGGVMNHPSRPELRIDVTQHQMHSLILAISLVHSFPEK